MRQRVRDRDHARVDVVVARADAAAAVVHRTRRLFFIFVCWTTMVKRSTVRAKTITHGHTGHLDGWAHLTLSHPTLPRVARTHVIPH